MDLKMVVATVIYPRGGSRRVVGPRHTYLADQLIDYELNS